MKMAREMNASFTQLFIMRKKEEMNGEKKSTLPILSQVINIPSSSHLVVEEQPRHAQMVVIISHQGQLDVLGRKGLNDCFKCLCQVPFSRLVLGERTKDRNH
jgi:hypothetical protein